MENFRIRKAEFLNQNSLVGLNSTKAFFAQGVKIVFQQYRSKADLRPGTERVGFGPNSRNQSALN